MRGQPLVSIVLVFLNAERFIQEAIESVLAQSYSNWELILVDDGSSDSSAKTAQQFANKYPEQMRCLQHPGNANRGISASRNLGIENSNGTLISFIDADDVWLSDKLAQQAQIAERYPYAAMICGPALYWYSWSDDQTSLKDFVLELDVATDIVLDPPGLLPALLQNPVVTSTGSLIRREIIDRINGFEESFRGMFEDQVFCAKVCLEAPVFMSKTCLYKYRRYAESFSADAISKGKYYSERHSFLTWLESYLLARETPDQTILQTLNKEKRKCKSPRLSRIPEHFKYRVEVMREFAKLTIRRALPASFYAALKRRRKG